MSSEPTREKKKPTGDYAVGYCRPPETAKFTKGQPSANPYGRPRKLRPGLNVLEILNQPVDAKIGEKVVKVSGFEVAIRQLVKRALTGEPRYVRQFIDECKLAKVLELDETTRGGVLTIPWRLFDQFQEECDRLGGAIHPRWLQYHNSLLAKELESAKPAKRRTRKQKLTRPYHEILRDIANEKCRITHNGRVRRVSTVELVFMALFKRMTQGDARALTLVNKYRLEFGPPADSAAGYLVVPGGMTVDEYLEKYGHLSQLGGAGDE